MTSHRIIWPVADIVSRFWSLFSLYHVQQFHVSTVVPRSTLHHWSTPHRYHPTYTIHSHIQYKLSSILQFFLHTRCFPTATTTDPESDLDGVQSRNRKEPPVSLAPPKEKRACTPAHLSATSTTNVPCPVVTVTNNNRRTDVRIRRKISQVQKK
jgi:hypothetical protein